MADLLGSVFFRTQFAVTVVQDRHSLAGGLLPTVQQVKMQLRCSEVRAANSLDDYSEIDFIAGKNNGIIIQGESLPAAVCCLLCYWPLDSTLRVSQEGIQTLSESTPSCLVRLQRLELRTITASAVKCDSGMSNLVPVSSTGRLRFVLAIQVFNTQLE
ncbi:uncharacterized protein LOC135107037 isoform X12 [Scylla paramamosain]|uniref:uncharacterized protein LOC135107037 isoform X12 n=1 Tax=Scylla paramamosain TaxID=85552 RepID=UPI00308284CE